MANFDTCEDRREFDGYLKAKVEEITKLKEELNDVKEELSEINSKIGKLTLEMSKIQATLSKNIDDLKADMRLLFEKQGHIDFKNYIKLASMALGAGAIMGLIGGWFHKYFRLF